MVLSTTLADRIRRLIPSLASTFEGEVIATRNALGRELAAGGVDWHALAAAITGSDSPDAAPQPCSAQPPLFGDLARACRDLDRGRLTQRERIFVEQMCALGFARQPSSKQQAWMRAIFASLQPRGAA